MNLIRYQPNREGLRRLRSSQEMDAMLETRAQRIASAAQARYDALYPEEEIQVEVVQEGSDTRAPRARVAVITRHPAALRIEHQHRVLGGALDAARG